MKKTRLIIVIILLICIIGIWSFFYYTKFFNKQINEIEYFNGVMDNINTLTHEENFYDLQENVSQYLRWEKFTQLEIDTYFSHQLNYDGFFYPDKNVYCIDVWWAQQHFSDYKFYTFFKNGTFRKNAPFYAGAYRALAENYLDGKELSGSSDFYKMLVALNNNQEKLLSFYNNNDPISFKKEILKLNNGNGNHDSLTLLFFQKHDLSKDKINPYLNQCFDYDNEWLFNEDNVKPILYKYLLKAE